MEKTDYIVPLRQCCDILKKTKGVNYVILCANIVDKNEPMIVGGSGWNIEDDETSPDFFTMVGGLVERYLEEQGLSYMEKIRLVKGFHDNLLNNLTNGKEK